MSAGKIRDGGASPKASAQREQICRLIQEEYRAQDRSAIPASAYRSGEPARGAAIRS
jgi:hypothetical protein